MKNLTALFFIKRITYRILNNILFLFKDFAKFTYYFYLFSSL